MTTPIIQPQGMTPIDLNPVADHLDFLENLIQESGYDAAAAHLFSYPMRGEPLMQGRDPISGYLNDAAPPEIRCEVREDGIRVHLYRSGYAKKILTTILWSMDAYPGILGFMYCIEDLRYPQLDEANPCP
jgi:hypothetical protein